MHNQICTMRKCIRCNAEMVEKLEVLTNDAMGIRIGEKGIFKRALGKLNAAACAQCGYTELYIDSTERLKVLAEKE